MNICSRIIMPALAALLLLAPASGTALAQNQAEAPALILGEMDPLREIILPRLIPIIVMDVSSSLGDATLINRLHFILLTAMVDAAAPYDPSAVGIYSRFQRQPAAQSTARDINIAMLYAAHEALRELMPRREAVWREMMRDYGLDPDADGDLNSPVGIGRAAGKAAIAGRLHDGMNQLGDYADTTGYQPVNSAYELRDPSRWQPGMRRRGSGLYTVQHFVTPQQSIAEPFALFDPREFRVSAPEASNVEHWEEYKSQADDVLAVSANLTDEQKMMAELFDNKIVSLGMSFSQIALDRNLTPPEYARGFFLTAAAIHDASVVIWQEKARYDAVRPFSAIRHIYGDELVRAWAGPGLGARDIPASHWRSYLPEADHPEYPSGSTCGCYAQAQAMRRVTGSDALNWNITFPAGSSRIEPGITPKTDIVLNFPTWTDFAQNCGQSRVWGGVHFQAAVDASAAICSEFGDMAYDYYSTIMDGSAELRPPSQALSPDPWRAASSQSAPLNPPPASSPMSASCEALPDSIAVTAVSSGFECQALEIRGSGAADIINGVELAGDLGIGAQVCFRGRRAMFLLEAAAAPPRATLLTSYSMPGMTCAWMDREGLLLAPLGSSHNAAIDGLPSPLDDCALITREVLNLRRSPDGGAVGLVPANAELSASARDEGWFQVSSGGKIGWISADFVDTEGTCG